MLLHILIISYILFFYRNFELIFLMYATEEGPHMWPKLLPYFLRFFFFLSLQLIIFNAKTKRIQNNKLNKNSMNFGSR